ncbi:AMP-binding protein [Parvularcula sp. IMCC14364]|uniref:AMP-binding protein n=1 Tax=Parvularcula sp. IMCC14364 TaxID=3067902 RepID=UPI0027421FC5|nr:AMP-binding protein [Parvularcula sp. IMCC14364]
MTRAPSFVHRLHYFDKATAFIEEDGRVWRYADLAEAVTEFARQLGPHRRLVLIETRNQIQPLVAYLACLQAAHPVILMPHGAAEKDDRIETVFQPNLVYREDEHGWSLQQESDRHHHLHPDLRVLLTTSGTTGTPKLVRLSGENLQSNAASIADYLDISSLDRAITTLPVNYSYGLSIINSHLQAGASVSLTDRSVSSQCLWEQFREQQCTSLAGVPYTYELLDRVGFADMDLPSLRTLTQAGGKLPPEKVRYHARLAAKRGYRFHVMYGQTEATARMGWLPPELASKNPHSIGQPIPGGSFTLRDATGKIITRHDREGELIYSGANVMMGYADQPDDLARAAELTELETGDLAVRNRLGLYRITGRKSRFCKLYGLRFNLDDIEASLTRMGPQCAVSGDDELICVCVRGPHSTDEIEKHLRRRYTLKRNDIIVWAAADFPVLENGKTDYRQIMATGKKIRTENEDNDKPHIDLAGEFAATLRLAKVPRNASFTSLQGDSLSYVQASVAIEEHLGYLPKGWETISVGDLQLMKRAQQTTNTIDTDIALKAAAILMVVAHHAGLVSFAGGAMTLLMLAGFNTARFQLEHLLQGRSISVLGTVFRRIILPYFCILLLYLIWRQDFHLPSLTLSSNFFGTYGQGSTFLTPYWFVEVYAQIVLCLCAVFAIPQLRKLVRTHPFESALTALGISLLLPILIMVVNAELFATQRLPHLLIYVFAFGWAAARADNPNRKMLLMVTGLITFPLFMGPTNAQGWIVAGAFTLLLWFPRLSVSGQLKPIIMLVGGASFYIYLLRNLPVHLLTHTMPVSYTLLSGMAAVILSLLVGIAAETARQRLPGQIRKLRTEGLPSGKYHGSSSVSQ